MDNYSQSLIQRQKQTQVQKQKQVLSQRQIQAVNFLQMGTKELREEIFKAANENPAIEIVREFRGSDNPYNEKYRTGSAGSSKLSDDFNATLESKSSYGETLQDHLLNQLNMMHLSADEMELSKALIYNLDEKGFYGSNLSPETLLNKNRPMQTPELLKKCMESIQKLDPVGTCCKDIEESLYVQAKIRGDASVLTLFILDGNLRLIENPVPEKVLKRLIEYREKWHSRKFAPRIPLDRLELDVEMVEETISYIRTLEPRPAAGYVHDIYAAEFNKPDFIFSVEKVAGEISKSDYTKGIIKGDSDFHFQVKYSSGEIPEVRISPEFAGNKELFEKAKVFIQNLEYRESSCILQGCAIVEAQKEFFIKGPGHIAPLTRRTIAKQIGIHESTVSRMSGKKNPKFVQTEWGPFPASYFFSSGVNSTGDDGKISAEEIKFKIQTLLASGDEKKMSDQQITEYLNSQGIKISRRTVAKYRNQAGINNSYFRM
ncbi:MAG: hypothetical protein MJ160_06975 [Treponema sp.]|nr:hypothetical protein [Treponema sp.]